MASEPLMFVTGSKTFEITDYSIVKGIGNKNGIQSERFTVGGYDWVIQFHPQGINDSVSDHVSVSVKVLNATKEVRAMYSFRLKDWTTSKWSTTTPSSSDLITFSAVGPKASWGYHTYIKRSVLEASNYLKDDTLVIKCTLWVTPPPPLAPEPDVDKPAGTSNQWNPSGADISFDKPAGTSTGNQWNTSGADISF